MKLLIATTNNGKLEEYRILLRDWGCELLSLNDVGLGDKKCEEDGKTFKENAIKKAQFYFALSGLPTLADDGGIEIDYLNGEPGIYSRRWPGHEATDEELIALTLKKLDGVPQEKRTAHFVVEIAFALKEIKETPTFEGRLNGYITTEPVPMRISGYPFRTIFYMPELGKTLGELPLEEEAKITHRRYALEAARPVILPLLNKEVKIETKNPA
ncbi:MAG: non-canonical purine NTP pyrophosphatase [Candidatus Spechtbacteria bacterium]|nr:non-canonical purine NTP pyrophosphatase [Candidatus Spechtbacteria bacterium]